MEYSGTCLLKFKGEIRACIVKLDPENEHIVVQFPMDDSSFSFIGDKILFDKIYKLRELNINFPLGNVKDAVLPNLLLINISPGTMSIYDSSLIRTLRLYKTEVGLTKLIFTPKKSLIQLPINDISSTNESELIFFDNRLSTKAGLLTKIGNRKLTLTGDRNILIVRAKQNLILKRDTISRALSLLQGGQILYRAGFYKTNLELNFIRRDLIRPLGPIFDESSDIEEFIEKYIAYEKSISATELHRHKLAIDYIIQGCAGSSYLENKVISLFTALEILDGSRTLNKNSIHSTLGVSIQEAELIVGVRNKLIHQGKILVDSIQTTISELNNIGRLRQTPFKISNIAKTRIASNFRFYLLVSLLSTIINRLGMQSKVITYRDYYK